MRGQTSQIILDDMLIRDERALKWIEAHNEDGRAAFSHFELAEHLKCHRNTAAAIVRRLIQAQMITFEARRFRHCVYRLETRQY